jgi:hypothetical protein
MQAKYLCMAHVCWRSAFLCFPDRKVHKNLAKNGVCGGTRQQLPHPIRPEYASKLFNAPNLSDAIGSAR